ncbi:CerR family C-terminal domain-containing protein [Hephaestia mangrovi]|uniref:CerR family C-terminal domain-containing protein n=1 Tax=Hephaestia mangrovi TaxID=2873268 RepID=UPI001CA6488E|nr:CerR family C-terminal domain-containing protein [Hephaestia mangrovi]MBY8827605.1 CerR family C-terminal domain-containing protein [Hephaestia mangrovi]
MAHDKLLEVAVREFGQRGLEGASTRGIAAAAGTAMSSITYHYGGKKGLYLAAADYIAQQMEDVGKGLEFERAGLPETPEAARAVIQTVLGRMIDKLTSTQTSPWSMFIVREQMNPTEAFDRIYAGPMGRFMEMLVELVCIATGRRDRNVASVAVVTLFGQVLAMRAARATCARLFERPVDAPDLIAEVRARIAANTDAILDRLIAERQEPQ